MKKFVSIVIALVMVLSMTSAFALNNCFSGSFAWTCPSETNFCGRGTVEIVPFVKVNVACAPYYQFEKSECAAAVSTDDIYFAIQLNVEANPDDYSNAIPGKVQADYWWNTATISFETEGIKAVTPALGIFDFDTAPSRAGIDWDNDEAASYYWSKADNKWVDITKVSAAELEDFIYVADVENAHDAEVCATLEAYCDGMGTWYYGDYKITAAAAGLTVEKDGKKFEYTVGATDETVKATDADFQAEVIALLGLNGCAIGTCYNADSVEANFGWDDEQEDCFGWDDTTPSIVNPECSVEIPKTGDVSVVAYAVMAIVAAAGTMLKK